MRISKAVEQAINENKCIALKGYEGTKIKPVNETEPCILMNADGSEASKHGWQPTVEQLITDDWIVVD